MIEKYNTTSFFMLNKAFNTDFRMGFFYEMRIIFSCLFGGIEKLKRTYKNLYKCYFFSFQRFYYM